MRGAYFTLSSWFFWLSLGRRYQDGRKMWTNVSIASRNMAQMVGLAGFCRRRLIISIKIWIHVPNERPEQSVLENIIEKKAMINLVSHNTLNHFFPLVHIHVSLDSCLHCFHQSIHWGPFVLLYWYLYCLLALPPRGAGYLLRRSIPIDCLPTEVCNQRCRNKRWLCRSTSSLVHTRWVQSPRWWSADFPRYY